MNPFLEQDQRIVGDGYTARDAMENLTTLCDEFGSRFGGTEGERLSAEFMRDKLIAYGLQNVHLEEFPYVSWHRGKTTLEITHPIQRQIDCISLPYSPPCDLEATLLDIGDGAPADFEARGAEMSNQIVMANSIVFPKGSKRWVHRSEKYGRSMLNGAAGFIFMNHYPAYGPATGGIGNGDEGAIPGISVSYEDGCFLQRLLKKHGEVRLRIRSNDRSQPNVSWNVIGDLPGSAENPEMVMLGSHYDGHDISQGAQDPASGAAAVLETARLLAKHAPKLPHTVRFVLWGVEEIGLLGSHYYANAHADELDNLRFYFNMDAAGSVKNKGVVLNEWDLLEAVIEGWRDEMAHDFGIAQSVNAFSDHYPFLLKGVPTGGLQSVPARTGGRGYGHTRYDTLDKVTLRELQDAAVMAARLALRFATASDWPVQRRSQEEVDDILNRPEYVETGELKKAVDAFYAARKAEG